MTDFTIDQNGNLSVTALSVGVWDVTALVTNALDQAESTFTITITDPVTPTDPVITGGLLNTATSPASIPITSNFAGDLFWRVDADPETDAATVIGGGGEASGSSTIGAGTTNFEADLAGVADGQWHIHCALDGVPPSNVIHTAFGLETIDAPSNTVAPVVSGEVSVGGTLSCTDGTWTGGGTITIAKQWRKAGVDISGQTADDYKSVVGDIGSTIDCVVSATNATDTTTATSNSVGPIVDQPVSGVPIAIVQTALVISDTVFYSTGRTWDSVPFTVAATGANKVLFLIVDSACGTDCPAPPTDLVVEFNGAPMTEVQAPFGAFSGDNREWSAAYILTSPPAGDGVLQVTTGQSTRAMAAVLIEMNKVDQATPVVQAEGEVIVANDTSPVFLTTATGGVIIGSYNQLGGTEVDLTRIETEAPGTDLIRAVTGDASTSDVGLIIAYEAPAAAGVNGFNIQRTAGSKPQSLISRFEIKEA